MDLSLINKVFTTKNENFAETVWEVFKFQAANVVPYKNYIQYLGINPSGINQISQIPFLPISFFKSQNIIAQNLAPQQTFLSSSTTGKGQSKHHVADISIYETAFTQGFKLQYGNPSDYCILALLPSYLERTGSSLVYMANRLITKSKHPNSGFYLDEWDKLANVLQQNEEQGQKTLLLGVSFALLDFVALHPMQLKHTIVMETGGMKGRRKELTRFELHKILKEGFGVNEIHSEYGMTELFSQAYAKKEGRFVCPPWMKVYTRPADDPFGYTDFGKTGALNIIDLANIYSCSFIETEDLGRVYDDGSFEVLGRMDFSEVRGCNTMIA
jgi:phenylacetate-coenzyme A ligase PaaK-like adenylate-forming protein